MTRLIRLAAVTAALILGSAGCASEPTAPVGPSGSASATSPAAATGGTESVGEGVLGSGRHPVYLKTVDLTTRMVTFDLVEFYTGDDAKKEWAKDNPGVTEEPALNGYYIRNNNTKLRTLPLAGGAIAKVLDTEGNPESLAVPLAELVPPYVDRVFWLNVLEGKITSMEEQFRP